MISSGISSARRRRWLMRATTAVVVAGSLTAVAAEVSTAQAAPAGTTKQMVKVVTRHPYGKMLATVKGRSLYYIRSNKCNTQCLKFWPPLLMPKNSTATPTGISCLKTVKFGQHRRQVTYRNFRLFTFISDSGGSVKGNGQAGFFVAKVRSGKCPK